MRLQLFVAIFLVASTARAADEPRVVQVYVALADNAHQGIVPVPAKLGNGADAGGNLYWGAAFGVKTFFKRNADWVQVRVEGFEGGQAVLERVVFKHRKQDVFLVADAYRGERIRDAIEDFLAAAAGRNRGQVVVGQGAEAVNVSTGGGASLVAYVGHNGLMDFDIEGTPERADDKVRDTVILACASKNYFSAKIRALGDRPLLWTTNLMAPETYVLSAALDGWVLGESAEKIRDRAAIAYDKYQHCGVNAAKRLLATGF